jgi:ubiquinone/menaquinone biosynthesis C-methylase UbiE
VDSAATAPRVVACPRCHGRLDDRGDGLSCAACACAFPRRGGIVDFSPEIGHQPGLAQRFMESGVVAWMYERAFRPVFTRLGSSIRYADEEHYLTEHLRPVSGPLLDIACGTGRYTRWLARRYDASQVVGLDLSFPMLRRALHISGKEQFVRASALALPFADGTFGGVNCFAALHLFPDPARAVEEVARVLLPGGTFTCLTAGRNARGLRKRAQDAFARAATFRFFDPEELRQIIERANMIPTDFTFYGSVLLFCTRKAGG